MQRCSATTCYGGLHAAHRGHRQTGQSSSYLITITAKVLLTDNDG